MSALAFNNQRVQQLRRLIGRRSSRHDEGRFVVEGPVLVAEAVAAGWECEAQFVATEADGVVQPGIEGAGAVFELADGVLERVASTETPQNPIAIVRMPRRTVRSSRCWRRHRSSSCSTRIADPGNLGTILRSAEASGADLVVLTPGSVDPYNPKVVRASAGALFHVPVVEATLDDVVASGLTTIGTTSHDAAGRTVEPHTEADFTGRVALVMGNEAAGLPDEWTDSVGPDPTLGHDPARRAQRVAQRGDGHDRARVRSGPPACASELVNKVRTMSARCSRDQEHRDAAGACSDRLTRVRRTAGGYTTVPCSDSFVGSYEASSMTWAAVEAPESGQRQRETVCRRRDEADARASSTSGFALQHDQRLDSLVERSWWPPVRVRRRAP